MNYKIAHFMALCGIGSRRNAEEIVRSGNVTVNGAIMTNCAARVFVEDDIRVNGKKIKLTSPRLFIFNKPKRYLVTHENLKDKKNIFDIIDPKITGSSYLTFVGRLDFMSEGLLLLTNSPNMADKIMCMDWERKYIVHVDRIDPNFKQFLNAPVLGGLKLKPIKLEQVHKTSTNFIMTLILTEGKNREIRRICEKFSMKIFKLKRIQFGPFKLDLELGEIEEVDAKLCL